VRAEVSDGAPLRETEPVSADRRTSTARQQASARPAVPAGWDEGVDLWADPAEVPQLADTDVPDELREEIESALAKYPNRESAALPALHAAQRVHGWCSPQALRQVAAVMRVTPAYLSSLTTFYDMFNTEPVGRRYVYVCTSVACNLVGAQQVFEALREVGADLENAHVRQFECMGACDMAPMASVDGRYLGPLDPSDARAIAEAIREGRPPLPGRGLEAIDEPAQAAEEVDTGGGPGTGTRAEGGARRDEAVDLPNDDDETPPVDSPSGYGRAAQEQEEEREHEDNDG
jgi:NADH-quinone oxidoreductase subunit E